MSVSHRCCEFCWFATIRLRSLDLLVGVFGLLQVSLNFFLGPITAAGALAGGGDPSPQKLLEDFRRKTKDFEYSAVFRLIFYATVFFSSFGSPDRFPERPQVHF